MENYKRAQIDKRVKKMGFAKRLTMVFHSRKNMEIYQSVPLIIGEVIINNSGQLFFFARWKKEEEIGFSYSKKS